MQKIAVWNTAFLGDAILTLPVIQNIKKAYPSAEIDFYVRGGFASLFAHHPDIANVIAYDKKNKQKGLQGFYDLASVIKKQQYDAFICAHTSLRSAMLARFSGAPVRIGYKETPAHSFCFTHAVCRNFGKKHEVLRLLGLLEPLHIPVIENEPVLHLDAKAQKKAQLLFEQLSFPVLGIHPGSAWETKRWPAAYFAQVAIWALQQNIDVMLFAGPGEELEAAEVASTIKSNVSAEVYETHFINTSGTLSLSELAAYIGQLTYYITNDSGPMHMAWVQKVPLTAIFGPTVESFGFFPWGEDSFVAETPLACRPCGLHGGKVCSQGHHNCMKLVTPATVWEQASNYLILQKNTF